MEEYKNNLENRIYELEENMLNKDEVNEINDDFENRINILEEKDKDNQRREIIKKINDFENNNILLNNKKLDNKKYNIKRNKDTIIVENNNRQNMNKFEYIINNVKEIIKDYNNYCDI